MTEMIEDEKLIELQDVEKKLSSTAYKLEQIYKNISKYEDNFVDNAVKQEKIVASLGEKTDYLSKISTDIRDKLAASIQTSIVRAVKSVDQDITKECVAGVESTVQSLKRSIYESKEVLDDYKYQAKNTHLKAMGVAIIVLVLANTIALKYLIPKAVMTPQQLNYMVDGENFRAKFDRLSQADKNRINSIFDNARE